MKHLRGLLSEHPLVIELAGFTALVGLAFIWGFRDDELRPNFIAELWGLFGTGTVFGIALWWLTEQRSERVQRAVWMRDYPGLVLATVRDAEILAHRALYVSMVPFEISVESVTSATNPPTHHERERGAHGLYLLLTQEIEKVMEDDSLQWVDQTMTYILSQVPIVQQCLSKAQALEIKPAVARLPELQMALSNYLFTGETLLSNLQLWAGRPVAPILVATPIRALAVAAIRLNLECSQLLEQLGKGPLTDH